MKRIFLLVLLSAYNMMMMASVTQQVDTIYEDPTCLYDYGYEMIEGVYEEKRRLFLAALFEELVARHPAECKRRNRPLPVLKVPLGLSRITTLKGLLSSIIRILLANMYSLI